MWIVSQKANIGEYGPVPNGPTAQKVDQDRPK